MNKQRAQTAFLYGVFACYLIFLGKLLLFSRVAIPELFSPDRMIERSVNFIPFHSIREYLFSDVPMVQRFASANVLGNIIAFIPLGAYLLTFKKDKRILTNVLLVLGVSVSVEILQGVFGLGAADIDDVILNSVGGLVGILGYRFFLLLLREHKKVRSAITILSALGLPVLLYLLFVIRLRL